MITHQLTQGSPEWHAYRAKHFNASDAPAMMACSPYKTRTQLLDELSRGFAPDVDSTTAAIFAEGHRTEALARPLAEEFIGKHLYPVTGSNGELSASFDGLTMAEDEGFEHKSLNKEIRAAFADIETIAPEHRELGAGKCLPLVYRVQMEQQLAVCEGKRILFMASKWQNDALIEEQHCWYYPDLELRAQILAGWDQLKADLVTHTPAETPAVEKIIAEPVEALPTPHAKVSGELIVHDNFDLFGEQLRVFLAEKLIREPKTDEDFVNLGEQIKAMKRARVELKSSKAQMLAQVAPIDRADKVIATLDKLLQENCSLSEKLFDSEKLRRKSEVINQGVADFNAHIAALNQRLGEAYMPSIPTDFHGVTSGLKSLASMEDKVASELARAKIAANEVADRIQVNLETLRTLAVDHVFLFADTASIVLKASDDLEALVKSRIAEHKAKEEAKLEAERERIRKEEQERADREAREKLAQQEREAEAKHQEEERARRETLLQNEKSAQADIERAVQKGELAAPLAQDIRSIQDDLTAAPASQQVISTAQRTAAAAPAAPAAPAGPPTLKIGMIAERLGWSMTAEQMRSLGIEPAAKERGSVLYHESQFPALCDAIARRALDAKAAHSQHATA